MDRFRPENVAPDSRLTTISTPRGAYMGPMGWMEPSFCINCHRRGPDVPSENMRHFSWLCNPCFKVHGDALAGMVMSDQVWWEQAKQESLEKYGRELTHEELAAVAAADVSPLATLLREHCRSLV